MDEATDSGDSLTALVEQAQRGGEGAFRGLYQSVTPRMIRYASVIVGQDAEDVVAEAWLQIARDLVRFQGDGPAFSRFALTVTRNRARDLLRRRSSRVREVTSPISELPEPRLPLGSVNPDAAEAATARLTAQEAMARLATLPRSQAEAILLRVVLDLDTKSAA